MCQGGLQSETGITKCDGITKCSGTIFTQWGARGYRCCSLSSNLYENSIIESDVR